MAVLGIAALLLVFYGAVMCAVSGRKLYLSLIVWSLPVFFFVVILIYNDFQPDQTGFCQIISNAKDPHISI